MKFTCKGCGHVYTTANDPVAPHGSLVVARWSRDKTGLDHYAMACLKCGTIHDTVPTWGMFIPFFSDSYKTTNALPAAAIVEMYENSRDPRRFRDFVAQELSLPQNVCEQLVRSKYFPE
jgi:hypothetical protein